MEGKRIARCMGPWPRCGHAEGTCTADPEYQRRARAKIEANRAKIEANKKPDEPIMRALRAFMLDMDMDPDVYYGHHQTFEPWLTLVKKVIKAYEGKP